MALGIVIHPSEKFGKNDILICSANQISHADPLSTKLAMLKIDDFFTQTVRIFSYKLSKDVTGCHGLFVKQEEP